MKKLLIHLSILSLLAFVSIPMIACAPAAEDDIEVEVETEEPDYGDDLGDEMEEMGDEMEEMGDEMEEGAEEAVEEVEEALEGEEEPPPPAE